MRNSLRLVMGTIVGALFLSGACSAEDLDLSDPGEIGAPAPATLGSDRADPIDEEAAAACREACDGEYGPHGHSGEIFCLCRTTDAGEPCAADRDCEGDCLFHRFEPTDDDVGVAVGFCSEFETTFGCNTRIPDWLADLGPQPIPFEIHGACVD